MENSGQNLENSSQTSSLNSKNGKNLIFLWAWTRSFEVRWNLNSINSHLIQALRSYLLGMLRRPFIECKQHTTGPYLRFSSLWWEGEGSTTIILLFKAQFGDHLTMCGHFLKEEEETLLPRTFRGNKVWNKILFLTFLLYWRMHLKSKVHECTSNQKVLVTIPKLKAPSVFMKTN